MTGRLDDATLDEVDREMARINELRRQDDEIERLLRSMRPTPAGKPGYVNPSRLASRRQQISYLIEKSWARINALHGRAD